MPSFQLASLAAATLASLATAADQITIDPHSKMFIDPQGRAQLFHGQNVVYKVDPYIPSDGAFDAETSLNDEDIANLVKWG